MNDGLATPIVLLALAAIAAAEDRPDLFAVGLKPFLIAGVIAVAVGLAGAWALDRSRARGFSTSRSRATAVGAMPVLLFGLAEVLGGNAFITAFVGGLVFGAACTTLAAEEETAALLEVGSDVLGFIVWFLAGGILLGVLVARGFQWSWVLLAVLALTVLRIVPVALCLIGTGFRWQTIAFLGWFGPRGMATIVFGLLAAEELGPDAPVMREVAGVLSMTVVISVVLHGITAGPLSERYGAWVARTHAPIEHEPSVEPMRSRGRPVR